MTDHLLQSRPQSLKEGILLSPCPEGVFGVFRVYWQGELIYEKTPEAWKFPENAEFERMIDARAG